MVSAAMIECSLRYAANRSVLSHVRCCNGVLESCLDIDCL